MLRKALTPTEAGQRQGFRNRGHEIQRVETFSDAVFAFALTLLIVSLEVPKSFDELLVTMRGFFAFGICFLLLAFIWNEQNVFFRRYGLDDTRTVALNFVLNFVVLFYVYPLKFLFTLVFSDTIYGAGRSPFKLTEAQTPTLMMIYGGGFLVIYFIFALLYLHVLRNKEALALTGRELYVTRTKLYSKYIFMGVGLMVILMTLLLPASMAGSTGMLYLLLFPVLTIFHSIRGKRSRHMD